MCNLPERVSAGDMKSRGHLVSIADLNSPDVSELIGALVRDGWR